MRALGAGQSPDAGAQAVQESSRCRQRDGARRAGSRGGGRAGSGGDGHRGTLSSAPSARSSTLSASSSARAGCMASSSAPPEVIFRSRTPVARTWKRGWAGARRPNTLKVLQGICAGWGSQGSGGRAGWRGTQLHARGRQAGAHSGEACAAASTQGLPVPASVDAPPTTGLAPPRPPGSRPTWSQHSWSPPRRSHRKTRQTPASAAPLPRRGGARRAAGRCAAPPAGCSALAAAGRRLRQRAGGRRVRWRLGPTREMAGAP